MLTRLLESKNVLLISGIFSSLILLLFLRIGMPNSGIELLSGLCFLMGLGLNAFFMIRSTVLTHTNFGFFLMLLLVITFSGSVYDYHLSASFLFTTAAFFFLQELEDKQDYIYHALDVGWLLAFAAIMFWPTLIFMPVAFFVLVAFTSFGMRASILLLMGFFIPFLLLVQIFYVTDSLWVYDYLELPVSKNGMLWEGSLWYLMPFSFLLLLSLYDYYQNYNQIGAYKRFQYFFLGLYLFAWLLILYFFMGTNHGWFVVICMPISVFMARSLEVIELRKAREALLWVAVLSLVSYMIRDYIPTEAIADWFRM